jgi:cytochrome c-type biogenesis protein CcmF
MPVIGTAGLIVAFAASIFTILTGAIGGAGRSGRYALLSRYGLLTTAGGIVVASAALLHSFVTHDFSLSYVAGRSDLRMPMQYIVAAFWGGQEGSLLFWVLMSSTFGATAAWINRDRLPTVMPYFHAVLAGTLLPLLHVLVFVSSPFERYLVLDAPANGSGLNPLLQNPLMTIHPPSLLSGFATFAVPYAFAMGALLARDNSADWLRATRKWTLISWLFLSVGNILGGMWAYQELGWGGYWAWDPVENAALIPWFMASAYLHSVIIQEQRGMFRKWNAVLVGLTFITTILGTWMTRSGLIESVHTFAESDIGPYFQWILILSITATAAIVGSRWRDLQATHRIDSPISREGAFLLNNWILVGLAFVVTWGTLFPKFKEMVTGQAVAIGPTWFNKFTAPLGVILLVLMALGTLLPWRRVTLRALRRNFTVPNLATLIIVPLALVAYWKVRAQPLGVDLSSPWIAFAIVGFTAIVYNSTTIVIEFARGVRARMRATGNGLIGAFVDLVGRHRRRYGGYLVHGGVTMIFLAFCGTAAKADRDVTLVVGQSVALGDYVIRFDEVSETFAPDKREINATMTISRAGRTIGTIVPSRYDFNDYSMLAGGQPDPMKVTSEIAIRSTPLEDLYIALLQVDEEEQAAAFKMVVLPFTWWFWFGGIVLVVGTLIAMWPEEDRLAKQYWRARAGRAVVRALVAGAVIIPTVLFTAQMEAWADEEHPNHVDAPVAEPSRAEDRIVSEAFTMIMTTCEGCAGKTLSTASPSCYPTNQDKARIRQLAAQGQDLDTILNTFVAERGEVALAIPPSRGMNKLAWLVPGIAFILGVTTVSRLARRWSAGSEANDSPPSAPDDAHSDEYLRQLDEELAARS